MIDRPLCPCCGSRRSLWSEDHGGAWVCFLCSVEFFKVTMWRGSKILQWPNGPKGFLQVDIGETL